MAMRRVRNRMLRFGRPRRWTGPGGRCYPRSQLPGPGPESVESARRHAPERRDCRQVHPKRALSSGRSRPAEWQPLPEPGGRTVRGEWTARAVPGREAILASSDTKETIRYEPVERCPPLVSMGGGLQGPIFGLAPLLLDVGSPPARAARERAACRGPCSRR